jgi:transglutaminase-like putative cysteine protease
MRSHRPHAGFLVAPAVVALALPVALAASGFPDLTEKGAGSPRLLEPDPPGVLLLRRGELRLMDSARGETASTLAIEIELKILTAEGRDQFRRMTLAEGNGPRLMSFSGRTILADGEVVPVTEDALFVQRPTSGHGGGRTTVVFPRVEVGATLHYRYQVSFESHFYQSPWLFQSQLPTRRSEISYWIPSSLETRTWQYIAPGLRLERRISRSSQGSRLELWMEDLPPLPDEPFGPPLRQLASQFLLLVTRGVQQGPFESRLDTWQGIHEAAELQYKSAAASGREIRRQARAHLEQKGTEGVESQARALYRLVRDGIETAGRPGIFLPPRRGGLDGVLQTGSASAAEKALLLRVMLREAGIPSRLVWAADRWRGRIDLTLPNPLWFKKILLGVEIEGREVFLDPSDRRLAFARLAPGNESVPALALGRRRLQPLTLPALEAAANQRQMEIDLALEGGLLCGTGRLAFFGQAAWDELGKQEPPKRVIEPLRRWIVGAWEEFEIADLEVQRTAEEQELFVTWTMSQRPEGVPGDEVRLRLGRRFPARIDRSLLAPDRKTPVRVQFPFEDLMEVRLRWPRDWEVAALAPPLEHGGSVGEMEAHTQLDAATGSLHHTSRLRLSQREIPLDSYPELLTLLALEGDDHSQTLVLTRRR